MEGDWRLIRLLFCTFHNFNMDAKMIDLCVFFVFSACLCRKLAGFFVLFFSFLFVFNFSMIPDIQ